MIQYESGSAVTTKMALKALTIWVNNSFGVSKTRLLHHLVDIKLSSIATSEVCGLCPNEHMGVEEKNQLRRKTKQSEEASNNLSYGSSKYFYNATLKDSGWKPALKNQAVLRLGCNFTLKRPRMYYGLLL